MERTSAELVCCIFVSWLWYFTVNISVISCRKFELSMQPCSIYVISFCEPAELCRPNVLLVTYYYVFQLLHVVGGSVPMSPVTPLIFRVILWLSQGVLYGLTIRNACFQATWVFFEHDNTESSVLFLCLHYNCHDSTFHFHCSIISLVILYLRDIFATVQCAYISVASIIFWSFVIHYVDLKCDKTICANRFLCITKAEKWWIFYKLHTGVHLNIIPWV